MLGLGSSIVQSSRSYSEVITLYEQESFSTVGDWIVDDFQLEHDVSDSTLTAGETAPGSSNNDWLKVYFAQDYSNTLGSEYRPTLMLNQHVVNDLGGEDGDTLGLTAEIYLDGPWGSFLTGGYTQRALVLIASGTTTSDKFLPTDQELSITMPSDDPPFSAYSLGSFDTSNIAVGNIFRFVWNGSPQIVKAGCSIYLRNINITVERY